MHPHYHQSRALTDRQGRGRGQQPPDFDRNPELLIAGAQTDWRSTDRTLSFAVNDLVANSDDDGLDNDDRDVHTQHGNPIQANPEQARWTNERRRRAEDEQNLRVLAEEFGVPSLRVGMRDNRDGAMETVFSHHYNDAQEQQQQHNAREAPPQPWVSVHQLVANKIRQEVEASPTQLQQLLQRSHRKQGSHHSATPQGDGAQELDSESTYVSWRTARLGPSS